MITNSTKLDEARKLLARDTAEVAEDLFMADNPDNSHYRWITADRPTLRNWILTAAAHKREAQQVLDEEQARVSDDIRRQAKYDACDKYRTKISGTVPAHRLDTRQNGFLDGWDAALAWAAGEASK